MKHFFLKYTFVFISVSTTLITVASADIAPAQTSYYCGCNIVNEMACIENCMKTHSFLKEEFWDLNWQSLPDNDKFKFASNTTVEYVNLNMMLLENLAPTAIPGSSTLMQQNFISAYQSLPESVKNLTAPYTGGFQIVNMGGRGAYGQTTFTTGSPIQYNSTSNISKGVWAIDETLLDQGFDNQFVTGKFKADNSGYKFRIIKSKPGENSVIKQLQFTLLSLLGSNLSIAGGGNIMPWLSPSQLNGTEDLETVNWNWTSSQDNSQFIRKDVSFEMLFDLYNSGKLEQKDMVAFFAAFQTTSFADLSSVQHFHSEFRSAFQQYVWTIIMNNSYKLEVSKNGQIIETYESCFISGRCLDQKAYFDNLFTTLK